MKRYRITLVILFCLAIPGNASAVGGGDLTFAPINALPVVFSHDKHVTEKGLKCVACHYATFQMARGSNKMDMAGLSQGNFCGTCHNAQKAFDVKNPNNCKRCHRQTKQVKPSYGTLPVRFSAELANPRQ